MLMPANIINLRNSIIRFVNGLRRPSKRTNQLLMRRRGQSLNAFVIREATSEDIHDLALLHVKTWSETYGGNGTRQDRKENDAIAQQVVQALKAELTQ